jgi:hypothetical protein
MIQGRCRVGFTDEPLMGGSVLLHVLGQELEGDLPAKREVIREENLAHPSLAQLFSDSVV